MIYFYASYEPRIIGKMAGIYIHIPFCRKLCFYCDFHFTVSLKQKSRVIEAIELELERRRKDFEHIEIGTIYFGGGTPSILSSKEINNFIEIIEKNYRLGSDPEITIEANPDDLTGEYLNQLRQSTPVNRLSIGVQSFNNYFLKMLNRRHSAEDAIDCIQAAKGYGFKNINIDLIYGIPGMSIDGWQKDLALYSRLKIPHLSAYHLSIEPKTVFAYHQKKGELKPANEEESIKQFEFLMRFTSDLGYEHYEISNFALPEYYSKHNLGYWTGEPYLGVGPSAHSYMLKHRRWNIANNTKYCEEIEQGGEGYYETELIDQKTGFNDYLITALRTQWGVNLNTIRKKYGKDLYYHTRFKTRKFIEGGQLIVQHNTICLSNSGKLIADFIIREIMI